MKRFYRMQFTRRACSIRLGTRGGGKSSGICRFVHMGQKSPGVKVNEFLHREPRSFISPSDDVSPVVFRTYLSTVFKMKAGSRDGVYFLAGVHEFNFFNLVLQPQSH